MTVRSRTLVFVVCAIAALALLYLSIRAERYIAGSTILLILVLRLAFPWRSRDAGTDEHRQIWRGHLRDISWSVACGALAMAWAWVGAKVLPDTNLGAFLIFGPVFLLIGAGVFFFSRLLRRSNAHLTEAMRNSLKKSD